MTLRGDWSADWCKPCVYRQLPDAVWGYWELLGKCMRPMPVGFSVIYTIPMAEFTPWFERTGIKDEYKDEVFDILQDALSVWQANSSNEHPGFDPKILDRIKELAKANEQKWPKTKKSKV